MSRIIRTQTTKNKIMQTITTISIISALVILMNTSCNHTHSNTTQEGEFTVPELKVRENSIGSDEEAKMITARYAGAVKTLAGQPNNNEAKLQLAEVFIAEGRITGQHGYYCNAAISTLDRVLHESSNDNEKFQAYSMKGMVQLTLHQFSDALKTGEEALKLNKQNSGIHGVLIDANVELGNYAKAVELSDKMISIRPDLRSYSRVSYLREIHGEMEGAIEAMDMAVKAGFPGQEQTEWCRVNLGKLYENTGQLDFAEMHYRMALEHRGNYPFALAALGNLERKKGNLDASVQLLRSANSFMEDAGFYQGLALTYAAMNNETEEAAAIAKAISLLNGLEEGDHQHEENHGHDHGHGHSHEVGLEMAKLHLQFTGDLDAALENALHEHGIRPNNIEVNQVLAIIHHLKGDSDNANTYLQKAQATNSSNPGLTCAAGLIKIQAGNVDEGKALIQRSFETDPFQEHVLADKAKAALAS